MNGKSGIQLLVSIAVIGLVAWILMVLIPMPAPFGTVIIAVACLIVLVMALKFLGMW